MDAIHIFGSYTVFHNGVEVLYYLDNGCIDINLLGHDENLGKPPACIFSLDGILTGCNTSISLKDIIVVRRSNML